MSKVLRPIAAFVAGMLVTLLIVIGVEVFSAVVHPTPPDFKGTMEEMCRHVEKYPNWVLAAVVPAWAAAAFAGTWVSGRIGNRVTALLVGALILAGLGFNVAKLPYTAWFKVVILIAVPLAVVLGDRLSRRREPAGV